MLKCRCQSSLSAVIFASLMISLLAQTKPVGAAELALSFDAPENNDYILALHCYQGKLYAGTGYRSAVYMFDGSTWSLATNLDNAFNGNVHSFNVYNGDLYAGTNYYDSGMNKGRVWRYNGTNWNISHEWSPDNTIHHFFDLAEYSGKLYGATGDCGKITVFDGGIWSDSYLTGQTNVNCLAVYEGKLFAGSYLHPSSTNGIIYAFDGTSWSIGFNSGEGSISSMAVYNDKLYAGSYPDGIILVYDGDTWSESFNSPEDGITSLYSYNEILYAGGHNSANIYTYNGTEWTLYCSTNETVVRSMVVFNEKLYIATETTGKIFEIEQAGPSNQPPFADAGEDQSAHPGDVITLDGSCSNDPDNNYPLSYIWTIIEKPQGSQAELSNPNEVISTFEIDLLGDYQIQLKVLDAFGIESEPDTIVISTFNSPPVANAGSDQVVQYVGAEVQLNGSESYDPDQDDIFYNWQIIQRPQNSHCQLSDPSSVATSFLPDEYGDYIIELTVNDSWQTGQPDQVLVTFQNLKPIAVAEGNQSVVVYEAVYLNGSESSDENGDPLTYRWSMVTRPEGSASVIDNADMVEASFVPDVPGQYIIHLVVNDNTIDSDPDELSVVAISYNDFLTTSIQDAIETIKNMPGSAFLCKKMKKTLIKRLNVNLLLIDRERYNAAYMQLKYGLSKKTDGCSKNGFPDKNDWIRNCDYQWQVLSLINQAIEILEEIILSD